MKLILRETISNNQQPRQTLKICRGYSLFPAYYFLPLRVAEDVDPYKEESNVLMRRSPSERVFYFTEIKGRFRF